MASLALGRYEEELRLYVEIGKFNNLSEASRRAVEQLIQSFSDETRMLAAIHAYKTHGVSITRAAEIAGAGYDQMRERLLAEGVLEEGEPPGTPAEGLDARTASLAERLDKRRKSR